MLVSTLTLSWRMTAVSRLRTKTVDYLMSGEVPLAGVERRELHARVRPLAVLRARPLLGKLSRLTALARESRGDANAAIGRSWGARSIHNRIRA